MNKTNSLKGKDKAPTGTGSRTRAAGPIPGVPIEGALAKITAPLLSQVYERQRLFDWLDQACARPIIWIQAAPGSGKTTLIASYLKARKLPSLWYQVDEGDADIASFIYYLGVAVKQLAPRHRKPMPLLTPEYVLGLSTFCRNYFRELFGRLKSPSTLVVDNYQEAPAGAALHEVLPYGLDEIPPGVNVIILSRAEPPAAFARLRVAERIALLEWNDLQFTEDESLGLAGFRRSKLDHAVVLALHRQAGGWAAGLLLMLEQGRAAQTQAPSDLANQAVLFDYFANEVFRATCGDTQRLLLNTAFLPKVPLSVACQLCNEVDAEGILSGLARRSYFTVRHGGADDSYEYHPLFRAFLVNRAIATYAAEEVRVLKQRSALLLADDGNGEAAVSLLQQAEDWSAAEDLIVRQAPTLVQQGRSQTLAAWICGLPASVRDGSPWLLYWLGMCRLPTGPAEARGYFEQGFVLFERQDDSSPLYLSWSGIIDSYVLEWNEFKSMDKWLDMYSGLRIGRKPPTREIEATSIFSRLAGLFHGRSDAPDLPALAEHAQTLFMEETDINRRFVQSVPLLHYFFWQGDVAKAQLLLEVLSPYVSMQDVSPLARIGWFMQKSLVAQVAGFAEEGLAAATDGIKLAQSSGVHVFDALLFGYEGHGLLWRGEVAAARESLNKMAPLMSAKAQTLGAFFSYLSSVVASNEGDFSAASEAARQGARLATSTGVVFGAACCFLALSSALAHQGDFGGAFQELERTVEITRNMKSAAFAFWIAFVEADIHWLRGDHPQMLRAMARSIDIGKLRKLMYVPWCPREDVAELYGLALAAGLNADYICDAITKMHLLPPPGKLIEQWPWRVKIYTLGRFGIIVDGNPLSFSTKVQKRPLELLKVLIALGGRQVREDALAEALYPGSDGDSAANALTSTLHRLRKLIGEDTVERQEGRLTLDARYCWVDVWALDRALSELEQAGAACDTSTNNERIDRALALYRGSFLGTELDANWAMSTRERLRAKLLRGLEKTTQALAKDERHEDAISYYRRALDVDPLAEGLCRGLMHSYFSTHRRGEALTTYEHCRRALNAQLGINPSAETEALALRMRVA